jgi:uncharacterized protein YerC
MTDTELFKKRYSEDGATYKELKKEFRVSFSTINVIRVLLCLPKRERSFARLEVDEELFLELYNSRSPYYTYKEIANKIGCCTSLIVKIKQRMNLSDREPKPRLTIDEDKFKHMYINGDSYDLICQEIGICVFTIQKLKKKVTIQPMRNNISHYYLKFQRANFHE